MRPNPRIPMVCPRSLVNRMRRWRALPTAGLGDSVVETHLPVPGQQQRHHVVADLVHAVVRHVGDGNAQLGRRVNRDVINAHAVPADAPANRSAARTTAGVTCAKHVMIASQSTASDASVSSDPVRRLHHLNPIPQPVHQNLALRRCRRPNKIGNQYACGHGRSRRVQSRRGDYSG